MEKNIYTITVMTALEQDELNWPYFGNTRTIGWLPTVEEAHVCVSNNYGDIYEDGYYYAVIEEVEMGLYPCCKTRWFYQYNEETNMYCVIQEPEWIKQFVNLGIG